MRLRETEHVPVAVGLRVWVAGERLRERLEVRITVVVRDPVGAAEGLGLPVELRLRENVRDVAVAVAVGDTEGLRVRVCRSEAEAVRVRVTGRERVVDGVRERESVADGVRAAVEEGVHVQVLGVRVAREGLGESVEEGERVRDGVAVALRLRVREAEPEGERGRVCDAVAVEVGDRTSEQEMEGLQEAEAEGLALRVRPSVAVPVRDGVREADPERLRVSEGQWEPEGERDVDGVRERVALNDGTEGVTLGLLVKVAVGATDGESVEERLGDALKVYDAEGVWEVREGERECVRLTLARETVAVALVGVPVLETVQLRVAEAVRVALRVRTRLRDGVGVRLHEAVCEGACVGDGERLMLRVGLRLAVRVPVDVPGLRVGERLAVKVWV